MKILKLSMCLILGIFFSNSTIEAAKSNFDRHKPNVKAECKNLKGEAKKKCHAVKNKKSIRGNDAIVRKKPGRIKLDPDDDCDGIKTRCKKKAEKKPD